MKRLTSKSQANKPTHQQNGKPTNNNPTAKKAWPGGMRARALRRPPARGEHGVLDHRASSRRVLPDPKFPSPKFQALDAWPRILAKPGGVLTPPYPPGGPAHSAGPTQKYRECPVMLPKCRTFFIFCRFLYTSKIIKKSHSSKYCQKPQKSDP